MSVLARLWDRVSGSQPLPPAWVIGLTGLVALAVVLNSGSWRQAGKVITIAHEGGHALVSVLSGRRLDGIRLHSDSSGVTYSRGKRTGPGLVLTAAAGYVMPSLLGAGAAWLLAERHLTAMLYLALVLLAATFLAIRNLFGALAVLVRLPGRVVPAVRRAAPGGRAGPRPAPSVGPGLGRGPAGPADRHLSRPVDHAVRAGRAGRPGRRRRPARAARLAPRPAFRPLLTRPRLVR